MSPLVDTISDIIVVVVVIMVFLVGLRYTNIDRNNL